MLWLPPPAEKICESNTFSKGQTKCIYDASPNIFEKAFIYYE